MKTNAGLGSGFDGDAYAGAGPEIIEAPEAICERRGKCGGMKHLFCLQVFPDEGKEKNKNG